MAAPVDFVKEVRPLLQEHCYSCHGKEKQKSGLRLDIKSEALKGGDSHAPNIKPGKASESPLIHFIEGQDEDMLMPPKDKRLSPEEIALLRRWIDEGAAWPEGIDTAQAINKRDWWSFKPLQSVPSSSTIDSLLLTTLRETGLTFSPEASRRDQIRRLYAILHGLPPTPEEVESFVNDPDPAAYEKRVDQLLDSPRYGEKWARHWLDVIAFGETHGFEVNTPRPNAWPYRDYVIQALNKDIPYPQFILEQLAGDTCGADAATGLMVAAAALLPGQIGKDEESKAKARQDELNDMVSIVGGAFLGLTLHCARCHDHKFDPVSQADYFGLQAVFSGVRHGERPVLSPELKAAQEAQQSLHPRLLQAMHRLLTLETPALSKDRQRSPVHTRRNLETLSPVSTQKLRFTILATSENNRLEPCIDELEVFDSKGNNIALASTGAKVTASGSWNSEKHRLAHLNDGEYGNDRSWISTTKGAGWVQVEWPESRTLSGVVWGRDRLDKYQDRLPVSYRIEVATANNQWQVVSDSTNRKAYPGPNARLEMTQPEDSLQVAAWHDARGALDDLESKWRSRGTVPVVYAGRFEKPAPSYRLNRGDVTQPREAVPPSAVTTIGPALRLSEATPEQQRRIALARWLADPANPLPARVFVNRLWLHHFGEGLVSTPNDLGRNGALPTHPQLLDYLAGEFIRGGWSMKRMHKQIVMSQAWRQSSAPQAESLQRDAQTKNLWRFPPRRMDAEALRDGLLAVSGSLDLRMGGPGFSVFAPNNNYVRVYDPLPDYGPEQWRRMIYMTKVRMAQDSTFGSFDCPDAGQTQPKRARSTTALQALSLLNSGFVVQQSERFAARLQREAGPDVSRQIHRAFSLCFQRAPDAAEVTACTALIQQHGLTELTRVLFNTNEFLFIP